MSDSAGPSSPRPRVTPAPASNDEIDTISASLASKRKAKRRDSSIFHTISRGKNNVKNKVTKDRPAVVKDEEEEAKVERAEYEKQAESEYDAIIKGKQGPIGVKHEDVVQAEQAEQAQGRAGRRAKKQEYVWDVLFENQRGIYLAGKAFFSSRGLLPADPSAFTLPSHTLPSASSFTVAEPGPNAELSEEPVETTSQPTKARKTIKTGYTLETFQTPSPDWVWMTPWMINMRTGTDEGGWRYNYWFRSNGWKASPGSAGWGGWVRRREWVRLRTLAADDEVLEPPAEPEKVDPGEELHVLMGEGGVDKVVKALSKEPLDRTRLETWERWLEKGNEADKRKLQTALDDDETVHTISKTFTYQSTVPALFTLFASHDLAIPSQADTVSTSPIHTPPTEASRFHATSHHPHPHHHSADDLDSEEYHESDSRAGYHVDSPADSKPAPASLTAQRDTPSASPVRDNDD